MNRIATCVLASLAAFACQSIPEEAEQQLARPIDCETAQEDIARLEAEKVSAGTQLLAGVRSVVPAAAVAGILTGDTKSRAKVATGAYNRDLDEKIFQIRQQCKLPVAEVTDEGLYVVEGARVGFAAMKPGVDFANYSSLIVLPVYVAFKDTRENRELPEEDVDRLRRYFHEAMVDELEKEGGYRMVTEPGPDVLLVRPALVDIVVKVPPERTSARDRVYISEAGEVTLIAEFRDSQTGELLARAADRRRVESPGGMYYSSPVTNAEDVRRTYRYWAGLLRKRLDEAHELRQARQTDVAAPPPE